LLLVGAASVLFPANNQIPQKGRFYFQRGTQVLERERSFSPVVENPELSFFKFPTSFRITGFEITLETPHRIDEEAGRQAQDWLD